MGHPELFLFPSSPNMTQFMKMSSLIFVQECNYELLFSELSQSQSVTLFGTPMLPRKA